MEVVCYDSILYFYVFASKNIIYIEYHLKKVDLGGYLYTRCECLAMNKLHHKNCVLCGKSVVLTEWQRANGNKIKWCCCKCTTFNEATKDKCECGTTKEVSIDTFMEVCGDN